MKIKKPINPKKLRQQAYISVGDQLDSIIKTFAHLQNQGIDIGQDGKELVEHSKWVKSKFAKS